MDSRLVPIRGIFVAHARRKVDGTRNLFVEQDVTHRRKHKRVKADSKFTHITSAFIRIKNSVQALVVARFASRFDNLPLLKNEANIAELLAFVKRRRVVMDNAFDTPLHRRRIDFAIGFNPFVKEAMCDILFDEKIAGSIHFTPGMCYDDAYNGNQSAIHWDLVLIMRPEFGGGEIWFDDKLIRKDGLFVVDELKCLNPDRLG